MPAAWPVPAHSVAICEGLEDWGAATDFSNISDSDEEDQPAPLVRFLLPLLPVKEAREMFFGFFIKKRLPSCRAVGRKRPFVWLFYFQVAGRYRVMVESSMASADDISFDCGDVIQLLQEEMSGMW